MTDYVDIAGGRIAYDVIGEGPLLVLSHGIGDRRQAFRFLVPKLAAAGYRVATADIRGHGDSSMNWQSGTGKAAISRTDVAGDLIVLIRHLGGPAVIIGHSISGGAAVVAAATEPDLITAIVPVNPFAITQKLHVGALLKVRRYRRGIIRLLGAQMLSSLRIWISYLNIAYPTKPADYDDYIAAMSAKLREPGRMAEFMKTGKSTPADSEALLPDVRCQALIIMGAEDPDFPDPRAEGEAIAARMPARLATVAVVHGAGHYPHAQSPDEVAALMIPFLANLESERESRQLSERQQPVAGNADVRATGRRDRHAPAGVGAHLDRHARERHGRAGEPAKPGSHDAGTADHPVQIPRRSPRPAPAAVPPEADAAGPAPARPARRAT